MTSPQQKTPSRKPSPQQPSLQQISLRQPLPEQEDEADSTEESPSAVSTARDLFSPQTWHSEAGYSLIEIMVVVVIIGILALIAVPRFTGITTQAKMTEAQTMLRQVYTLQQSQYYRRDMYTEDLSAIGFEQAPLVTDGGTARYRIEVESADEQGFVATATAVVDFDNDGQHNVWEVREDGDIVERTPD